jgi:hypothetical protein
MKSLYYIIIYYSFSCLAFFYLGTQYEYNHLRNNLINQGAVAVEGNALNVPTTNYIVIASQLHK